MPSHTIAINDNTNVIVLHTMSSIKFTGSNFPAWKVQFNFLLIGYDLLNFVDVSKPCPAPTHGDYEYWTRQDQLILHEILSSMDIKSPYLAMQKTVNKHGTHWTKPLQAKREHVSWNSKNNSRFTKGSKPVVEYLHGIKALYDELAVINSPLDDIDLVIHTLNGLGLDLT